MRLLKQRIHIADPPLDQHAQGRPGSSGGANLATSGPEGERDARPVRAGQAGRARAGTDPLHAMPAGVREELGDAMARFQSHVADPRDRLLFLVNPLRALSDAGVVLSTRTMRYLQRARPGLLQLDPRVYEALRNGEAGLPFVKPVEASSAGARKGRDG